MIQDMLKLCISIQDTIVSKILPSPGLHELFKCFFRSLLAIKSVAQAC